MGVQGFQSPIPSTLKLCSSRSFQHGQYSHGKASSFLFQSGTDDDAAPQRRRKRVKRKEAPAAAAPVESVQEGAPVVEAAAAPIPEVKPREDAAVNLQVKDVRDLVGQYTASTSSSDAMMSSSVSESTSSASSSTQQQPSPDDSLEMLLQDAKEMQALEEKKESSKDASSTSEEGGFSIGDTLKSGLSTLVTVDFFVVCAFLLWFLAGIFCSYILKDDTVQIAFNSKWLSFCIILLQSYVSVILYLLDIFNTKVLGFC